MNSYSGVSMNLKETYSTVSCLGIKFAREVVLLGVESGTGMGVTPLLLTFWSSCCHHSVAVNGLINRGRTLTSE